MNYSEAWMATPLGEKIGFLLGIVLLFVPLVGALVEQCLDEWRFLKLTPSQRYEITQKVERYQRVIRYIRKRGK